MSWKDWSYIKKGVFIGSIFGALNLLIGFLVILFLLDFFDIIYNSSWENFLQIIGFYYILAGLLGWAICGFWGSWTCELSIFIIFSILSTIIIILIGAFIGWIVGKVKSRGKK